MSKHKPPKNDKYQPRKYLKDYTGEGTKDCKWEASGEILPGDRKDDKFPDPDAKIYPFVANHDKDREKISMTPEIKDSDRVYPIKDMQDGNPKMSYLYKVAIGTMNTVSFRVNGNGYHYIYLQLPTLLFSIFKTKHSIKD